MSLFGTSPPGDAAGPTTPKRSHTRGSSSLFDDEASPAAGHRRSGSSSGTGLFSDEGAGGDDSPWDMPTPRKQQSRAELIRKLLPTADAPESYIEVFDTVVREDGADGRVSAGGIAKVFSMARLDADAQASIMAIVVPGNPTDVTLGRNEFNVLLALVGLAQEGDVISLDGVDERRRSKFEIPRFVRCACDGFTTISCYFWRCSLIFFHCYPMQDLRIRPFIP